MATLYLPFNFTSSPRVVSPSLRRGRNEGALSPQPSAISLGHLSPDT
jgi:hypothetical protein